MQTDYLPCFSCGAPALNIQGETHAYMLSSPGCWAMFCELMEREFSSRDYWKGHQYTVDAYAVQHTGNQNDSRARKSVNIHLAALYAHFEKGLSLDKLADFRMKFSQFYKEKEILQWIDPPNSHGGITVFHTWNNENPKNHLKLSQGWARSAWNAWSHEHNNIAKLVSGIY